MFAIAGATGNTGSVVASTLLARGKKVRVIVRSEDKAAAWRARGAETVVGALEDAAALGKLFAGAEGAYLLCPPDNACTDLPKRNRELIERFADAAKASAVGHLVFLSSVGAQHADGTGPIKTIRPVELLFPKVAPKTTFVRAAYFIENLAGMLAPIKMGMLPSFGDPSYPFAMVATQDIGEVAAAALLEPPAGSQIIELSGPAEYSMNDAAASFARALGKPVQAVLVPPDQIVGAMVQAGMTQHLGELYREMAEGMGKGLVAFEGGHRSLRGKVTLDDVVKKLAS